MSQFVLDLSPAPDPTLDNFVTGGNAELLQTLTALLAGAAAERFVYLWGDPGSGKSHLLRAFVSAARDRSIEAAYVPCSAETRFDPELSQKGALALDDVDRLAPGPQEALFHLYNRMREEGAILVASGKRTPVALNLRPDLMTRLAWGLVFEVRPLRDEEKLQALCSRARERGFELPVEVAEYLLRHVQLDMPSLLAFLEALDRHSLAAKRPVSLALLREILASHLLRK